MLFAAHLHIWSLVHGTIKSYMAAIRHGQTVRGLGDTNSSDATAGISAERDHEVHSTEHKDKVINRPSGLDGSKKSVAKSRRLLWAASSLCFFGFLRSGEVTMPSEREYDHQSHLCFEDVRVDRHTAPSYIQVTLKASKTDPFRQGVVLYLGATGRELCPVAALLSFMVVRENSGGPLFTWRNGRS